jgi:hypothetical protein
MRTFLFFLLLLPNLEAIGASEQYALKAYGIVCDAKFKEAVIEVAEANDDRSLKRAIVSAVTSGKCNHSGIDVPALIDKVSTTKTPRGALYYCYVMRGESDRRCSHAEAITTVAQLQTDRTGDFSVVVDNDKLLVAQCAEGGRVYIEKGAQWRRMSAVFFSGIDESPVERKVDQDKERAVSEGCRGLDF